MSVRNTVKSIQDGRPHFDRVAVRATKHKSPLTLGQGMKKAWGRRHWKPHDGSPLDDCTRRARLHDVRGGIETTCAIR
jgi:hypothetical protein